MEINIFDEPVTGNETKISYAPEVRGNPRTARGVKEAASIAQGAGSERTQEELEQLYSSGEDRIVSTEVSNKINQRDIETRKQLISDIVQSPEPKTDFDLEVIKELGNPVEQQRDLHREFSRSFTNEVASRSSLTDEASIEEQDNTFDALEHFTEFSTKLRALEDKYRAIWEEKSTIGKVGSVAATLVPFATWIARNDAVDSVETFRPSRFLPGNNLQDQVTHIATVARTQGIDEAIAQLEEAVEDVRTVSDFDAIQFLEAFRGYGGSDRFWDNAFGVIDVASLVPGVGAIKLAAKGSRLVKETTKATLKHGPDVEKVADAIGDVQTAAQAATVKRPADVAPTVDDVIEDNPSIYSLDAILDNDTKNSTAMKAKLRDAVQSREELQDDLTKNSQSRDIDVLSTSERQILATDQIDELQKTYKRTSDTVIDTKIIPGFEEADNVDKISVTLGKTNGDTFLSEKAAQSYKDRYIYHSDAKVVPVGGDRYGIEITRPIRVDENVRGITLKQDQITPERSLLGRLLYSDSYKTALDEIKDKRSVSDSQQFFDVVTERFSTSISSLNKKEYKDLQEVLKQQQNFIDPVTKKRRWFTIDEFYDRYRDLTGKAPSEKVQDSYVSTVQISNLEHFMRSQAKFRHDSRQGVSNYKFGEFDEIRGIQRSELPSNTDEFKVTLLGKDGKPGKSLFQNSSVKDRAEFQKLLDNGYKLIQAHNGNTGVKNSTHVLVKTANQRNLRIDEMVPYNPGGHLIYKNQHHIKQAKIRKSDSGSGRNLYDGDQSIFNVATAKQAQLVVDKLEEARAIRKTGDKKAFSKFMKDNFPELTQKDYAKIDFDNPFTVTKTGARTIDTPSYRQAVGISDDFKNPFDISGQTSGRFLGERDDTLADSIIVEGDVISGIRPSEVVQPIQALETGLFHALNERVMGDYVQKTSSRFVREFRDVIDMTDSEIRRNPLLAITDPKFIENANPKAVAKAKQVAQATNAFLQTPTPSSRLLNNIRESLAETAVNKWGVDSKIADFVGERAIHTVTDPSKFMRSAAFHSKLGLFNPKQLFLQSQVVIQIGALGGVRTAMSTAPAYALTHSLGLTAKPGMIKHADSMMQKFGWKKGEFQESHEALMDSGFDIVGSNVAAKDAFSLPNVRKNTTSKVLDHGTYFFKKGDHMGRVMGWHTAYRNWRKANPNKKLDRESIQEIKLTASDYTANQTSDMNAMWQRGFGAVPTQFWGFQARLFEQMISPASRLTAKQRIRLFSGTSLMYGIPVGLGASTVFWPAMDTVKQLSLEHGITEDIESNPFYEAMRDGIMATTLEMATGLDFDTSNFGPGGLSAFTDLMKDDSEWYDVFGGASAGVLLDAAGPVGSGISDILSGNVKENFSNFTPWDLVDSLKFISSVNNASKAVKAYNTGQLITSSGTAIQDITLMEALTSAITGLQTQESTDIWHSRDFIKKLKDARRQGMRDITKEIAKARRALENGNIDDYHKHHKRARIIQSQSGVNETEYSRAANEGFSLKTLSDSVKERLNEEVIRMRIEKGTN